MSANRPAESCHTVSDIYGGTAVATVAVSLPGTGEGFNLVNATPIGGGQVRLTYAGMPTGTCMHTCNMAAHSPRCSTAWG